MIKLFSLGKKKEEKHESAADDMLFAELQKIKEEIERGNTSGLPNLFGDLPSPQQSMGQTQSQQQIVQPPAPSLPPTSNIISTTPPQQQIQPSSLSQPALPPTPQPSVTEPVTTQKKEEQNIPTTEGKLIEHKEERAELYIKIDHYEKVLDILDRLKVKLKDLEHIINELKEIKEQENTKLEEMRDQLENTKENINDVLSLLKQ